MSAQEPAPGADGEPASRHGEELVAEVMARVSTVVVILAAAFLGAAL
jgi:hypothetical protein